MDCIGNWAESAGGMMADKFDPQTHRFGMAYLDNCSSFDHVVYPVRKCHGDPDGVMALSLSGVSFDPYEFAELTRALEHDLIPRADVDKLMEAIEQLSANVQVLSNVIKDPDGGTEIAKKMVLMVATNTVATHIQALAEFKQKYGDN